MTRSQQSIVYFSYYVLISGFLLLFFPSFLLEILLGEMEQDQLFIYHILGLIACCVGIYYWYCGQHQQIGFFKITILGRTLFFVGTIVIVLLTGAPAIMMGMGTLDFVGALWTYWALQKDGLLE